MPFRESSILAVAISLAATSDRVKLKTTKPLIVQPEDLFARTFSEIRLDRPHINEFRLFLRRLLPEVKDLSSLDIEENYHIGKVTFMVREALVKDPPLLTLRRWEKTGELFVPSNEIEISGAVDDFIKTLGKEHYDFENLLLERGIRVGPRIGEDEAVGGIEAEPPVGTGGGAKTVEAEPRGEEVSTINRAQRYADYTFFDSASKERVADNMCLLVGKQYKFEVAVRAQPTGIPPEDGERRPIIEPKRDKDVRLLVTVQYNKKQFEFEGDAQSIILPPKGDSKENAVFYVTPLQATTNMERLSQITVRLFYNFNLLEVVTVRAVVSEDEEASAWKGSAPQRPITFRKDRLIRPPEDLDRIQPRQMHIDITKEYEYLFHFTFWDNENQEVKFSAPAVFDSITLSNSLGKIRTSLYSLSLYFTDKTNGSKSDEKYRKLIYELARLGWELYVSFFSFEKGTSLYAVGKVLKEQPLPPGSTIQISVGRGADTFVFPWSLIYDRMPSDIGAIDLDGFWGFKYIIEQQLPNHLIEHDGLVSVEDKLKIAFMLWDRFPNSDKQIEMMKTLTRQSGEKIEVNDPPITNVKECYRILQEGDAHLLYFYTHGYTQAIQGEFGGSLDVKLFCDGVEKLPDDDPRLLIWQPLCKDVKEGNFVTSDSWIALTHGKLMLADLYGRIEKIPSSPLVILNMCQSAQITPSLRTSFIHFFLNSGARTVIGTECPMTVNFAHPFGQEILTYLLEGKTIGEALFLARLDFKRLNNPLGLAYTLFGLATAGYLPPRIQPSATQQEQPVQNA